MIIITVMITILMVGGVLVVAYTGKGIRYKDERVIRKAGKAAK